MKRQDEKGKLKSILVIITGFLVLSFLFKKPLFFHIALVLGLVSLIVPSSQNLILYLWNKAAEVLGWINTRIILTLVFYVFLFPVSIITKLFHRNLLDLKEQDGSLFKERNHTYTPDDLENPW